MAKTTKHAKEFRGKKNDELLGELKKLREELQKIRFTRSSGTAVSKLSKIKDLRKQIARILTVIRENKKQDVVKALRERVTKKEDNKEEEVKTTIKNLKMKHIPLDLRPKLTRAMRRRMTKFERKLVTLKQLKRKLNFPMRKFAVPPKA